MWMAKKPVNTRDGPCRHEKWRPPGHWKLHNSRFLHAPFRRLSRFYCRNRWWDHLSFSARQNVPAVHDKTPQIWAWISRLGVNLYSHSRSHGPIKNNMATGWSGPNIHTLTFINISTSILLKEIHCIVHSELKNSMTLFLVRFGHSQL